MKVHGVTTMKEPEFPRNSAAVPRDERAKAPVAVLPAPDREPAPPKEEASPVPDGLEKIAEEIQRYIREHRSVVDFSVDADLQMIVTRVLEKETGDVVRQYPPEAILEVMKQLRSQRGVLVDRKG